MASVSRRQHSKGGSIVALNGIRICALAAAITAVAGCGGSKPDAVRQWCRSVKTGSGAAALATQGGAPADPGDPRGDGSDRPIFRNYTVDGQPVTDWQYSDGVVISWHDGYVVSKTC